MGQKNREKRARHRPVNMKKLKMEKSLTSSAEEGFRSNIPAFPKFHEGGRSQGLYLNYQARKVGRVNRKSELRGCTRSA